MTAPQIRDAFAALTDRETVLFWQALPSALRDCAKDALHAELDRIADDEEALHAQEALLAQFGGAA
jgi:hypothetical protein